EPGSPAAVAGIERNDQFVRVDGDETPTWEAALLALLEGVITDAPFEVEVADARGVTRTLTLDAGDPHELTEPGVLLRGIGVTPWAPTIPAVIGEIEPESPAFDAGLRFGDR